MSKLQLKVRNESGDYSDYSITRTKALKHDLFTLELGGAQVFDREELIAIHKLIEAAIKGIV